MLPNHPIGGILESARRELPRVEPVDDGRCQAPAKNKERRCPNQLPEDHREGHWYCSGRCRARARRAEEKRLLRQARWPAQVLYQIQCDRRARGLPDLVLDPVLEALSDLVLTEWTHPASPFHLSEELRGVRIYRAEVPAAQIGQRAPSGLPPEARYIGLAIRAQPGSPKALVVTVIA